MLVCVCMCVLVSYGSVADRNKIVCVYLYICDIPNCVGEQHKKSLFQ